MHSNDENSKQFNINVDDLSIFSIETLIMR